MMQKLIVVIFSVMNFKKVGIFWRNIILNIFRYKFYYNFLVWMEIARISVINRNVVFTVLIWKGNGYLPNNDFKLSYCALPVSSGYLHSQSFSRKCQVECSFIKHFQLACSKGHAQLTFTSSQSTTETLEKGVKYVQS